MNYTVPVIVSPEEKKCSFTEGKLTDEELADLSLSFYPLRSRSVDMLICTSADGKDKDASADITDLVNQLEVSYDQQTEVIFVSVICDVSNPDSVYLVTTSLPHNKALNLEGFRWQGNVTDCKGEGHAKGFSVFKGNWCRSCSRDEMHVNDIMLSLDHDTTFTTEEIQECSSDDTLDFYIEKVDLSSLKDNGASRDDEDDDE